MVKELSTFCYPDPDAVAAVVNVAAVAAVADAVYANACATKKNSFQIFWDSLKKVGKR